MPSVSKLILSSLSYTISIFEALLQVIHLQKTEWSHNWSKPEKWSTPTAFPLPSSHSGHLHQNPASRVYLVSISCSMSRFPSTHLPLHLHLQCSSSALWSTSLSYCIVGYLVFTGVIEVTILHICPIVGMLNHMVFVLLIFWVTSILISIVVVPIYIPTNGVSGFPLLHIFARIG